MENTIAIALWIDDKPIQGSILLLKQIEHPRRDVSAYKEGDTVKAPCRGFRGLHKAILGKIGRASHRKEFDAMLNGVEFKEFVHKYVPEVAEANQPATSAASRCANNDAPATDHDHETTSQLISVPTTTPVLTATATTSKKRTSLKKKNASRLDTEPKAKNSKQTLKQLEAIANDLELTELQKEVESSQKEVESSQKEVESSQKEVESSHGHDLSVSQLEQAVATDLLTDVPKQTLTDVDLIHDRYSTSSMVGNGLSLLCDNSHDQNTMSSNWQQETSCNCNHEACDKRVAALEQDVFQKGLAIRTLENNLSSLWAWTQKLQGMIQQQTQQGWNSSAQHLSQQASTSSYVQQQSQQATCSTSSYAQQQIQPSCSTEMSKSVQPELTRGFTSTPRKETVSNMLEDTSRNEEAIYNGYTKSQLICKIRGIKDFSKASKFLFRCLYSEEEYKGRSLTGTHANKKFTQRPSLVDTSRLVIIYEIIGEIYGIGEVMVRDRLRDLLKPSRNTDI